MGVLIPDPTEGTRGTRPKFRFLDPRVALTEPLRIGFLDPLAERLQDGGVVRILLLLGEAQPPGPLDLILGVEVHGEAIRLDRVEKFPARGLFLKVRMRLVERVLDLRGETIDREQSCYILTGSADLLNSTSLHQFLKGLITYDAFQIGVTCAKYVIIQFHSSTFCFAPVPVSLRNNACAFTGNNRYICLSN